MIYSFASLIVTIYAPLDFLNVLGFPHPLPNNDRYGYILPKFGGNDEDICA